MSAADPWVRVPDDARAAQDAVSDPKASAWVTANAGSGKTFVLTRRVLRLLLDGAAPETILCLTYTKAAAAEMRHRVGAELARWALADPSALEDHLHGTIGQPPSPAQMVRARALFAHALETPGGLKIQTIHAFCEAVLHRFPYEAGVPVDFSVIEDAQRAELLQRAREAVLAEGLGGDAALADAVTHLFVHMSDHQIAGALDGALAGGRALDPILKDPGGAVAALRGFLGLEPDETARALYDRVLAGALVPPARYPDILAIAPAKPGGARFEDKIARIESGAPDPGAILDAYLTRKGTVPKGFPKAAFAKADPGLADALLAEAGRLEALAEKLRAADMAERSGALVRVLGAIIARFEADKRARSLLDFDDLIARANALFANPEVRDWVRYKLDAGIDHILVDESQDTNRAQWEVIDTLADDFFSGAGAARRPKTLFAVGDPKQSIYSFQGAEPELFVAKGEAFEHRARAAGARFASRRLRTSFRTLAGILEGVDRVANRAAIAPALLAGPEGIRHESARTHDGGTIEIWPVIEEPEAPPLAGGWPLSPPETPLGSAARQLATRIVRRIAHWTTTPTPLGQRGRAIRPEDVLILVQSRNAVFAEIVAQLRKADIASPGADRLPVSAHIVIDDLLGLADVLAAPGDDLLLAAILRSPLFGIEEDALYEIAAHRGKGRTLWSALEASPREDARAAFERLTGLRAALGHDRAYSFFAHVLYTQGGLKAFHARLGAEVDEVIAEFLDLALEHERSGQPSLTGFVARMRASEITVKRDLAERTAGVRVMTVHGAKGLEAPIVILADAAGVPPPVRQQVFFSVHRDTPFLLHCPGKDAHTARSRPLREAAEVAQEAEYWRNLYVGMTRAEDMLIVAGKARRNSKAETWHGAISDALADAAVEEGEGGEMGLRYDPHFAAPAPIGPSQAPAGAVAVPEMRPVARKRSPRTLSPSRFDLPVSEPFDRAGEAIYDARTAKHRGIAIHAMLEHLTHVPHENRRAVALTGAAILLPGVPEAAAPLASEALAILDNPAFEEIFGPDSRAEIAFSLAGTQNGQPVRVSGRFDRIVVTDKRVLVVDFKSDVAPPLTAGEVSAPYRAQLGLYARAAARLFPGRGVEVAIVWTATGRFMALDPGLLEGETGTLELA